MTNNPLNARPGVGQERERAEYESERSTRLLLPGALLMTMRAQLLAALMLVDLRFPTLF